MLSTSVQMASLKSPAIGIDLGTWKCCVGVVREGKVEIIKNERGCMTTPSYVAFTETERLVGEDAEDQVALNPTNTVYGVKRIIGRRFDDPHAKTHFGNFPFSTKQVCGSERTEIRVQYRRESKWLPPEHLTAMLLRKMKLTAEAYLGCPVQEAVVSVPACFNSTQRQATLDAAEIAGLKVLQLLHEPTAVALAYKDQAGCGVLNQTVMVVDAGGGTLQAAVASIEDGMVDVKALSGSVQFGGCDLDQFLVDECSKRLQFTQKIDISKNKKAKERLRVACHKAKCDLTLLPQTTIQVDSLVKDTDFETTIHREEFNKLFRERSDKLITEVVKDALKGAHLNVDQIDQVLVVGGSSRIPAIITLLEGLFPGKKLNTSVNIDEAVAHGAALQAALLAGDHTVANTSISDVTPRDFYLEHASNRTERGIVYGKNCTIPLKKIWNVSCGISGRQTLILLEDDFGLKPIKSYELRFGYSINIFRKEKVHIKIDRNGLISMLPAPLCELSSVSVPKFYNGIFDIQPHIRVEKSFELDEENEAMRLQASMKLESTCIEIKSAVKGFQNENGRQKFMKTYGKKCSGLITSCNEYIDWLDINPNVSMRKCNSKIDELKKRLEVLSVAFNSVICIKSEGNETSQNTIKPARQSEDRLLKNNVPKSMLATEEHFFSVPDIRRSRFPQASDASAMHGGGIDSRFPQASDTSAMHGGGIDSRFPQASDTSAMHGGGIDSLFPQASDASATHGGGIDIAIVKPAVANNPPETEMAPFDLRNKQIDAQNERSASPSTSSKSDQGQLVGSTTASSSVTSLSSTACSSVTSLSTTVSSSVTSPSTTASSSVTSPKTTGCKQGSDNSKSQVTISSSLTLHPIIHKKSNTETGIGVGVHDTDEKDYHSPVGVQENTNASDFTCVRNQTKLCKKRSWEIQAENTMSSGTNKVFGGEVDSCEQIVKKQCHWNPDSEFVPSSSMDRDGDNSCINRKDVCDRRNLAIKNGAKQSDERSSVSEGNGGVNPIDGRQDGGRSVSSERMRRLASEERQGETSAGNKATSEAKGNGDEPVRKHPYDAGPVTAINEMPCFLVRGREVEIQQEETSKQLNDSTEAQKITQPRLSSPRKSRVIHTGSTKRTHENETAITVDKQATFELKGQSDINEFNTSKPATASPQHQSTPHQHNSRPEKQPNQGHYQQQQLTRQHITSQQNTSSTQQRKDPAIGIDLGTWKCCVAVFREGKVEIIENERGSKTTPTYVAFTETERLVGEDAKDQVALNPTNTVFGVKRIIGRKFNDQSLQKDMKFWPFTVTPDQHDRPRIQLEYCEQKKVMSPEQVSAMMLEKMKRIAESHLGCEVRDAVISVPAYFNNSQRQATKDAGTIAGLNVLGLINEPTAAALAYRDNKARVEPHNVLIFDLGGGTFDVAVIRVDESGVKVKGVCGDAEFGGNEMDVLLINHLEEKFIKEHGKSVLRDKKGLERLRTASEKAKKTLSLLPKANVQVDSLIGDIDFSASIKRHDFEQLYYINVKERIVNVLTTVLKQANIPPSEIDEVVLVGGTSRIPKIQSILKEFFVGKALNKTVNPDEAVAHGAALRAALLAGDIEVEEVYMDDMFQVPPSTKIERMDDQFRNYRAIPKESFYILNCGIKNEDEECDEELEERFSHKETVMKLHKLNSFGIFEIFTWGNKIAKKTRIPEIGCLTELEITQLAAEVRQFAQDDQQLKEGVVAMSDLEAFCFQTKALVTSNSSLRRKLGQVELSGIADRCEEVICWLDINDSAKKNEYQHKKGELCCRILSVLEKESVKMEDFCVTEQEWFRELLKSQSEESSQNKPGQQNPPHLPWCATPTPVNYEHRRPSQQLMQLTTLANHELKQPQQLRRQPLSPTKQEQPELAQQPPSPIKQEQHDPPQLPRQPPTAPTRQVQPAPPQPPPAQTKQEQPKPPQQPAQRQPTPDNQILSNSYDPCHAPPHQVKPVSARGAPSQAKASEPEETTLQRDAPPHQVKPVSARGAPSQAHESEPVETTLQSDATSHQVKPVSARGAPSQAQASEPEETTMQSDEDSKQKIEDVSADYRAAETESGRQSSLQDCLAYAVVLPQPSENVQQSPPSKTVSFTNDNPPSSPKALDSNVFTSQSHLNNRVDSFTPNAQDAGNRLVPLATVSRIVSSSIANQSLSLSVSPATAFSTERTSSEFTGTSSSDSGISSPRLPDFSARTDLLESMRISLIGASKSSSASHSDPQSKSLESRPPESVMESIGGVDSQHESRLPESVVESVGGVDSAQDMFMAPIRPAKPNSCNINNGVEIKPINDKTVESNATMNNQQQQPLDADDSRVGACEAEVDYRQQQLLDADDSRVGAWEAEVDNQQQQPLDADDSRVGACEAEVDNQQQQLLDADDSRVGAWEAEVDNQQQQPLDADDSRVGAWEAEVDNQQQQPLDADDSRVGAWEAEVDNQQQQPLDADDSHVGAWEAEVDNQQQQPLDADDSRVGACEAEVDNQQQQPLDADDSRVGAREAEVDNQQQQPLDADDSRVGAWEAEVDYRQQQPLDADDSRVGACEAEVDYRQQQPLDADDSRVGAWEAEVDNQQQQPLDADDSRVGACEAEVDYRQQQPLDADDSRVGAWEAEVDNQQQQPLDADDSRVGACEAEVDYRQQQPLDADDSRVGAREAEVDNQQQQLLDADDSRVGAREAEVDNQQQQPLGADVSRVGASEAEVNIAFDALIERYGLEQGGLGCVRRTSTESTSVKNSGLRDESISTPNSETVNIADHKQENLDHLIAFILNGSNWSPTVMCNIGQVHEQVTKRPLTPSTLMPPGCLEQGFSCTRATALPHARRTLPLMQQCDGSSDLSTKSIWDYCSMETDYSYDCRTKEDRQLCFCAQSEHKVPFDRLFEQYIKNFANDPITHAQKSYPSRFRAAVFKRDSHELFYYTITAKPREI